MTLKSFLSNIHWIPVIVMTLASFLIGFLWHSKFVFGKIWKQENNPENIPIKINAPLIFGGTAMGHFLAMASLSAIVSGMGGKTGLILGLSISILWVLPAMLGTYLFASRSLKLLAIDMGMYILLYAVAGFILGIW